MMLRVLLSGLLLVVVTGTARADYDFIDSFPNLPTFVEPLALQDPMDGTDRLFLGEKAGKISVFANDPSVATLTTFLDLADSLTNVWDDGLLSFTFDPNYENNGFFYVTYVTKDPTRWKLSRFHVSADPNVADRSSEVSLLEIRQLNLYHKAGCLAFGPHDGYLYMTTGDDGWITDAPDLTKLKGKMLRIDVHNPSGGRNYGIPPDNPYAGNTQGFHEEIWLYGLRNPWRFSFDAVTNRLWIADVGLDTWEEINIGLKGRNYGWPSMEGDMCLFPPECDTTGLNIVLPLWKYPHTSEYGAAAIGGYVYRGTRIQSLRGTYIYSDHDGGEVWGLKYDGVNPPENRVLYIPPVSYTHRFDCFCQDKDNEIFAVAYINGRIWQMAEIPSGVAKHTPPLARAQLFAYPNPFAAAVKIRYESAEPATLDIYDVHGRLVRRVASRLKGSGETAWEGVDAGGRNVTSGIYFARLVAGDRTLATQRIVLLK